MMRTAKKSYHFMANRRYFWLASVVIIALGLIAVILMDVRMDIGFTGGTMLRYSYPESGIVLQEDIPAAAQPSEVSGSEVQNTQPAPAEDAVILSGSDNTVSGTDSVAGEEPIVPGTQAEANKSDGLPESGSETVSDGDPVQEVIEGIQPDYSTYVIPEEAGRLISDALGEHVTVQISTDAAAPSGGENKRLTVTFEAGHKMDGDTDRIIRQVMEEKYPNVSLTLRQTSAVDPSVGVEFIGKCVVAVLLAVLFMVLYVGLRYRSIGGWTAAISAIIAVIHDCLVAYFAFVLFQFPISDRFIAVLLAIIGLSLNSTIVIFDRVRENRRLQGSSVPLAEIADRSINESMGRTVCTDLCVFIAVAVLAVSAAFAGITSVLSFAVPMMFGVVSGCYSSLCIGSTLWVTWQQTLEKRRTVKSAEEM